MLIFKSRLITRTGVSSAFGCGATRLPSRLALQSARVRTTPISFSACLSDRYRAIPPASRRDLLTRNKGTVASYDALHHFLSEFRRRILQRLLTRSLTNSSDVNPVSISRDTLSAIWNFNMGTLTWNDHQLGLMVWCRTPEDYMVRNANKTFSNVFDKSISRRTVRYILRESPSELTSLRHLFKRSHKLFFIYTNYINK